MKKPAKSRPIAATISPAPKPVPNSSGIKITALETVIPDDLMPGLLLLRIHTDAGIIGHGETYYVPTRWPR